MLIGLVKKIKEKNTLDSINRRVEPISPINNNKKPKMEFKKQTSKNKNKCDDLFKIVLKLMENGVKFDYDKLEDMTCEEIEEKYKNIGISFDEIETNTDKVDNLLYKIKNSNDSIEILSLLEEYNKLTIVEQVAIMEEYNKIQEQSPQNPPFMLINNENDISNISKYIDTYQLRVFKVVVNGDIDKVVSVRDTTDEIMKNQPYIGREIIKYELAHKEDVLSDNSGNVFNQLALINTKEPDDTDKEYNVKINSKLAMEEIENPNFISQENITDTDTPNLDTLVDFIVNINENTTLDEFDSVLTDEVISKAEEEAEANEEVGKKVEKKIKAKIEELSKKLTDDNMQTDSISFDSIKLEILSDLLDKLFIDKSLSDDKRLKALKETQRLISTDIEAKRKLEDMIDDLAFSDDDTPSLF